MFVEAFINEKVATVLSGEVPGLVNIAVEDLPSEQEAEVIEEEEAEDDIMQSIDIVADDQVKIIAKEGEQT